MKNNWRKVLLLAMVLTIFYVMPSYADTTFYWNGIEIQEYDDSSVILPETVTKAQMLRVHVHTAGSVLTAQQPLNNVARITWQALSAVLGGIQSSSRTRSVSSGAMGAGQISRAPPVAYYLPPVCPEEYRYNLTEH